MRKVFLVNRRRSNRLPEERPKDTSPAYKGIATSIIVAIATAAIGYTVNFVDTHRKAQIEKVDRQIEKLYGPLYAYSTASHRAWYDLRRVTDRGTYFFDSEDKHMPSAELVEVWRRWMRTVFMPLNLKIEAAIVDNAQLLDGNRIYPCFVDLVSHVESYKATLASWKDTDDLTDSKRRTKAANTAVIEYPRDLESCIENRLQASLKRRKELERSWTGLFQGEPESSVPEPCKCKNKDPNLSNIVE